MENLLIKSVKAQTLPPSAKPIQRTIEEVNSEGVPLSEETAHSAARAGSQKGVLLGLGAILLIIIAVLAVSKLLQDSQGKASAGKARAKPKSAKIK